MFELMIGCLEGLTYFLNEHSDRIPLAARKKGDAHSLQTVFACCHFVIKDVSEASRYQSAISGLKLLARHASLFKDFIDKISKQMTEYIFEACRHNNPGVKHAAFEVLEPFMGQVIYRLGIVLPWLSTLVNPSLYFHSHLLAGNSKEILFLEQHSWQGQSRD